ncbi:hypothetical protein SUGI_0594230 [Cryptomeria japonica]|nr:hypothetical protein SUGI_0594230 [Cryptomeria japonica]
MPEERGQVTENNGDGVQGGEVIVGSFLNFGNIRNGHVVDNHGGKKGKTKEDKLFSVSAEIRAVECFKLERKLKEILMENEETLVDIQEFLYYYSQLNSPLFIDIVDRFFAELFV